ncbi:hypothetical protein SPAR1_0374 [Streptococcus pneumoniae GA02254]|nr:hypothetical protein SPAR1_0374 [Streptococcus pneumoniae GA02254]
MKILIVEKIKLNTNNVDLTLQKAKILTKLEYSQYFLVSQMNHILKI